jgi:hypothetical protein
LSQELIRASWLEAGNLKAASTRAAELTRQQSGEREPHPLAKPEWLEELLRHAVKSGPHDVQSRCRHKSPYQGANKL